jgi:hypothetical protein
MMINNKKKAPFFVWKNFFGAFWYFSLLNIQQNNRKKSSSFLIKIPSTWWRRQSATLASVWKTHKLNFNEKRNFSHCNFDNVATCGFFLRKKYTVYWLIIFHNNFIKFCKKIKFLIQHSRISTYSRGRELNIKINISLL